MQLKINERFQTVEFWGKIFGLRQDYIILQARSLKRFEIVTKWFFSEDEGLSFAELPPVEPWMREKATTLFTNFMGNSSFIYKQKKEQAEEEEVEKEEEEADQEAGSTEPDFTELQRLAVSVEEISQDCFIAPARALRLTTSKHFVLNVEYAGMTFEESRDLHSYVHLRQPEMDNIYNADTFTQTNDILTSIDLDPASTKWSLKSKGDGTLNIRNLRWPGFEFHTTAHCRDFFQGYFGQGIPRKELNWMITQPEE